VNEKTGNGERIEGQEMDEEWSIKQAGGKGM